MDTDCLSGSETHNRFIVEIIDRLSIVDDAAGRFFEKQPLKYQRTPRWRVRHRAVEMHDADQRVSCFKPEKSIVLFNGVSLYYIRSMVHNSINTVLSITYITYSQYKGNIFFPIIKALYGKIRNSGTFIR